jgi:hypothetical protein
MSVLKLMLQPVDLAFGSTSEIQEPAFLGDRSRPRQPHQLQFPPSNRSAAHIFATTPGVDHNTQACTAYSCPKPSSSLASAAFRPPYAFELIFQPCTTLPPMTHPMDLPRPTHLRLRRPHFFKRGTAFSHSGTCFFDYNLLLPTKGSD